MFWGNSWDFQIRDVSSYSISGEPAHGECQRGNTEQWCENSNLKGGLSYKYTYTSYKYTYTSYTAHKRIVLHTNIRMYICMYVCTHLCSCSLTRISCTHAHTVHMYTQKHAYSMKIRTCTCLHVHTHHIHTNIRTYQASNLRIFYGCPQGNQMEIFGCP